MTTIRKFGTLDLSSNSSTGSSSSSRSDNNCEVMDIIKSTISVTYHHIELDSRHSSGSEVKWDASRLGMSPNIN